jgi:hypothetical protein
MGRDRGEQPTPDLFSTETGRDGSPSPIKPVPATEIPADAPSQRHVLPKNLRKAVKHLSDGELDLLHAATVEEMGRRGRLPPTDQATSRTDKSSFHRLPTDLVDARADQCRSGSIQGGYQTDAHCATIWHIPIRCTQGVGDGCIGARNHRLRSARTCHPPSGGGRPRAARIVARLGGRGDEGLAMRLDDQRQRKNARPDPSTVGPELLLPDAAARTRTVSGGQFWPSRGELSRHIKCMARARIPEFESYMPSQPVRSLRANM